MIITRTVWLLLGLCGLHWSLCGCYKVSVVITRSLCSFEKVCRVIITRTRSVWLLMVSVVVMRSLCGCSKVSVVVKRSLCGCSQVCIAVTGSFLCSLQGYVVVTRSPCSSYMVCVVAMWLF